MPVVLDDKFAKQYWGLVDACNGKQDQVFCQSTYIKYNKLGKNVEGGVCLALSLVWNACGGSDGMFFDYINTKDGIGRVRGTQLLYQLRLRGNIDVGFGAKDEVNRSLSATGRSVKASKDGGNKGLSSPGQIQKAVTFMKQEAQYQLHYWGKGGGHAIAIKTDGMGRMKVFDPNAGMATFQNGQTFATFLRNMLETNYSDLNRKWCCMRIKK